jgi:formiminotetrahydrofolate cyclodeaminase
VTDTDRGGALTAGPAAALAAATAADVILGAARAAADDTLAAQAKGLRARLGRLAAEDARALAAARAALAVTVGGDERRDFALGRALDQAAAVPLAIAEACSDLVVLAGELSPLAPADLAPDVMAAAQVAIGSARAAAALVEVNLGVAPGDRRLARAHAAVDAAERVRFGGQ